MSQKLPDCPTTRVLVADHIGISVSTLKRKLKRAGVQLPPGLIYEPQLKQIEKVFYPDNDERELSGFA